MSNKRSIVTYPLKEKAALSEQTAAFNSIDINEDTDIATLLDKTLEILKREIKHLMIDSSVGKLNKDSSTALVSYLKLLKELRESELEVLDGMSDDELQAILEKRNVKTKSKSSGEGIKET